MSTRNSPEDLDMTLLGGRPISQDVEKADPPSSGFRSSSTYHSSRKPKKAKLSKHPKDTSLLWDTEKNSFVEPDGKSEMAYEKSGNVSFLLPKEEEKEEEPRSKRGKIDPYNLSKVLMKVHMFVIIDDTLHCYDSEQGFWRCIPERDSKDELRKMIPKELRSMVIGTAISDTYHWFKTDCPVISNDILSKRKNYLNFANGVFSLKT